MRFRLIYIDGHQEPPTAATTRGTLVHAVLEHLYDLPAEERTVENALDLIDPHRERLFGNDANFAALFTEPGSRQGWDEEVKKLVERYFTVENPQRLEPHARELFIEASTESGILMRGFVDRIDRAPNGATRVVDYKTGKSPQPRFLDDKLAQLNFYALLLRQSGRGIPQRMQLVFLADGKVLTLDPQREDVEYFGQSIEKLWEDIKAAIETEVFPVRTGPLCNWCQVRQFCPAKGEAPHPMDRSGAQAMLGVQQPTLWS